MAVQVIGMFALVTGGTQNAEAVIDVRSDGLIVGVDWDAEVALNAEENFAAELSFIATNQLVSNDVTGRISSISSHVASVTAVGLIVSTIQKWIGNFEIVISAGERIYIHADSTAGVAGVVRCNLFLEMNGAARRSTRRR